MDIFGDYMYSIIFSKKLTTDILHFIQNSVDISLQQVRIQLHRILLYLVAKIRCSYLAKAIDLSTNISESFGGQDCLAFILLGF